MGVSADPAEMLGVSKSEGKPLVTAPLDVSNVIVHTTVSPVCTTSVSVVAPTQLKLLWLDGVSTNVSDCAPSSKATPLDKRPVSCSCPPIVKFTPLTPALGTTKLNVNVLPPSADVMAVDVRVMAGESSTSIKSPAKPVVRTPALVRGR